MLAAVKVNEGLDPESQWKQAFSTTDSSRALIHGGEISTVDRGTETLPPKWFQVLKLVQNSVLRTGIGDH